MNWQIRFARYTSHIKIPKLVHSQRASRVHSCKIRGKIELRRTGVELENETCHRIRCIRRVGKSRLNNARRSRKSKAAIACDGHLSVSIHKHSRRQEKVVEDPRTDWSRDVARYQS